mmetsp:Transcript_9885/g.14650  ORF Transcript_9885/g.14650 Transcript_9885/m.14650 type:complete len:641 (-) Transcript_9885:1140-3062(-)
MTKQETVGSSDVEKNPQNTASKRAFQSHYDESFRASPATTKRKIKERCAALVSSSSTVIFMTLVTIYALFGDDVRILALDKSADDAFIVASSIAFFLFLAEIAIHSWCTEGYLRFPDWEKIKLSQTLSISGRERVEMVLSALKIGSFYFWLDLLATLSMILEIPWMSPSSLEGEGDAGSLDSARAGKASKAGAKAAKIIKIVRMVRLVRLVKLYKYFSENRQKKEGSVVPDDKSVDNMPPESHVGAEMSDRTTKKVIVGVLVMLVVIPMLQVDSLQYIDEFGMQMIFERRSALSIIGNQTPEENVQSIQSWEFSEQYFINTTDCIEMTYDGFNDNQKEFGMIPLGRSKPQNLRQSELLTLTIEGEGLKGGQSSIKAVFDNSEKADEEAFLNILLTSFVIILLGVGTMTFQNDVNNLVILPIEKMVQLIREISENPLGKEFSFNPEEIQGTDDGMETTLLLRTISKIAGLMRVGFGEAGAEIIGKNLNMCSDEHGGSSMNLLGNGTKITSIFGFCDIRNFTDTTECLQEEVMLFVNRIAHILHSIVAQCGGAANKNIGDAFLLTWKLDTKKHEHNYLGDRALYSLLKTMAEMNRHEDFICNFSPTALGALYERMPGYKCRMGCGLHVGWAVEGAIGSDKKN